jgi:hypothetical protein
MTASAKARSARWRDRRRLDAIRVVVDVLPAHRHALEGMGLIQPGFDRHQEAIGWAVARYLDTAPAMRAIGEALYPDWPEEAEDETPLARDRGDDGDNRHNVSSAGWPRFRQVAVYPQGKYVPRRHGNWKSGDYSLSRRAKMRQLRACIRALCRGFRGGRGAAPTLPPPGWRLFPFVRTNVK